jgi:UDP-N-acetyl-D-mannosaminuronic acid transferase (WecB/TagA/CpsF family)
MNIEPIKHRTLLGLPIAIEPRKSILEKIENGLQNFVETEGKHSLQEEKTTLQPYVIVTPNAEQTVMATANPYFTKILNQADLAIPDGIGTVLASRILKTEDGGQKIEPLRTQIPGVEFMQDLVAIAAKKRVRIALIGASADVALKAFECLKRSYVGLEGWTEEGPLIRIVEQQVAPNASGSVAVVHPSRDEHIRSDGQCEEGNGAKDRLAGAPSRFEICLSQDHATASPDLMLWLHTMVQKIEETGVGMVCIAYGAPKQEYLSHLMAEMLRDHQTESRTVERGRMSQPIGDEQLVSDRDHATRSMEIRSGVKRTVILMSVGGSFDMISGRLSRAPRLMRTLGLEWFYRLLQEPWRIKRQFDLVRFIMIVLKKRFFH